jgi:hypothetical protein
MEEQVCSREQMAELKKLGIDDSEASMCWIHYETDGADKWFVTLHSESCYEFACMDAKPTFSVSEMIGMLPNTEFTIEYLPRTASWILEFTDTVFDTQRIEFYGRELRDALFEALKWIAENEMLTEKEGCEKWK